MKKQYLEIGKIVNTHGIRGDIKVQPWCDSPDFLAEFDTLYRKDQSPIVITSAKVHKGCVLMHVEGVDTVEQAQALRGMTLYRPRMSSMSREPMRCSMAPTHMNNRPLDTEW